MHSHREIRTHARQRNKAKLMLMNHPFARPSLHWAIRCYLYTQTVTIILRNLILTLKFQIVLVQSCMGIAAHFWCQVKEDELNFVTMKIIFYKWFNFSGKITALSGFLFIGTHCIWHESYRKTNERIFGALWIVLYLCCNFFCVGSTYISRVIAIFMIFFFLSEHFLWNCPFISINQCCILFCMRNTIHLFFKLQYLKFIKHVSLFFFFSLSELRTINSWWHTGLC